MTSQNTLQIWSPRTVYVVLLVILAVYLSLVFDRYWIPHDEGVLGQQAVRLLAGELPHRDFHETYSGGLTLINAAAFKWLGVNSLSLRCMLALACLLAVSSIFWLLAGSLSAAAAALGTVAAFVWSFPNYFAGLPSWYVVTFWCIGVFCVERHLRLRLCGGERFVWLIGVGMAIGAAIAMKISGLFLLLAVVLHLCHLACHEVTSSARSSKGSIFALAIVSVTIVSHAATVIYLYVKLPTNDVLLNLILPNLALTMFLAATLYQSRRRLTGEAGGRLCKQYAALALGLGIVLLPALVLYVQKGALPDLIEGVFVRPARRTTEAVFPFPRLELSLFGVLFSSIVAFALHRSRLELDKRMAWVLAVLFAFVMLFFEQPFVYQAVFHLVRLAPPFLIVAVLLFLWRKKAVLGTQDSLALFMFVAILSLCSLIQFPFAQAIYFCYTAPFVWMLLARLVATRHFSWPRSSSCCALFFIVFAVLTMNLASPFVLGISPIDDRPLAKLELSRASLTVHTSQKQTWQPLIKRIEELARQNEAIFAGPDSPEISFLSGRANPTKILYEIFENAESLESEILAAIDRNLCPLVVVNLKPDFSKPYSPEFHQALQQRFAVTEQFGRFVLFRR